MYVMTIMKTRVMYNILRPYDEIFSHILPFISLLLFFKLFNFAQANIVIYILLRINF